MPIIFGWGKRKIENLGEMKAKKCGRCGNHKPWLILKVTMWITVFFIPVFPYKTRYILSCPICNDSLEIDKGAFEKTINEFNSTQGD